MAPHAMKIQLLLFNCYCSTQSVGPRGIGFLPGPCKVVGVFMLPQCSVVVQCGGIASSSLAGLHMVSVLSWLLLSHLLDVLLMFL